MSNSLIKIIDNSIFPAALMIAAKFIGLYITVEAFDLEWGIENAPNQIFSSRPVLYSEDVVTASSYSDLFLFAIMLSFFSYYVIKAVFFSTGKIDPKIVARLAANGLLSLIQDSYEIYRKATIWLVFIWIANLTIIINTLLDKTHLWIALLAITSSFILTITLLRDVVREIELARKQLKDI